MPQYKDKKDDVEFDLGLLLYPVLMAADIIINYPDVVIVGKDQVAHLDLCNDISKRFNGKYYKYELGDVDKIMSLIDPTKKMSKSDENEKNYISTLLDIKEKYQIEGVVFGDIDLEPHRAWEEKVCNAANLKAFLPLWQQDRVDLVYQMIDAGIETMIVSCNLEMGESYLGQIVTKELAIELQEKGIDPCGENGEFHTLVIYCPLFKSKINVPEFRKVTYENYCFLVWEE